MDVKELARTQREDHALVVLLQLVVHLRCYQCSKLPLWERVIFVERLTMTHVVSSYPCERYEARWLYSSCDALTFD
jgi:hypothetical protein